MAGDSERLSAALEAMDSTIQISQEEGIQADFSYQQHGPQIYNGGYGESFLNGVLLWVYLTHNTPLSFSRDSQKILLNYYLNSTMWMTRHGVFDFNVCGRCVSKPLLEKPFGGQLLIRQGKYLLTVFPEQRALLSAFLMHIGDEPHPFSGFRYFWRSDYGVKVTANYSVSVKMNSNRIKPIETGNQENLLGYWLGFGSMNIARNGSEYRDIFPNWDWTKIPGVTCPEIAMATVDWGQIEQQTSWAGGVTSGYVGIATFELDCQETQALKSWFLFDDVIVALGSGITSTHANPVYTTVNQCHASGKITVDGRAISNTQRLPESVSWIHHDGVGYVFGGLTPVELTCDERSGNWQTINANLDKKAESTVFQLSVNHGFSPVEESYQYCILPDVCVQKTQEWLRKTNLEVVVNRESMQVLKYKDQIGAVFFKAGNLILPNGDHLSVDGSCVLLIDDVDNEPMLHISTPGREDAVIEVLFVHQGVRYKKAINFAHKAAGLGQTVSASFSAHHE